MGRVRRLSRSCLHTPAFALVLFGQLLLALGFPVFATVPDSATKDGRYPCQNRPCGCLSAELCWQGDCCCFTLEEKLAWADANGVEPPEHVRPHVASRRSEPAAEPPCCCEAQQEEVPACCQEGRPETPSAEVTWVVGVFARKCRANGAAAAGETPTMAPGDLFFPMIREPVPVEWVPQTSARVVISSHRPPTPPPRP